MSATTVAADLKAKFGTAFHVNAKAIWDYLATPLALFLDVTAGTAAASAALVLDANKHVDTLGISDGGLKLGASGSETAVNATGSEINRTCDISARVVTLAVTTAITEVLHEGRTVLMTGAGGARTFTLPAATGGGGRYRFVVGEVNTSNYLIKAAAGTQLFKGMIIGQSATDSATDAPRTWTAGSTDDTITLNGTTTGGVKLGDFIEFEDVAATMWAVRGYITQSGAEATPFSDTVA
jgi:hypothetical protein